MIGEVQAMLHSVLVSVNDRRQAARGLVIIFRQTEGILGGRGLHAMREPAGSRPAGQEEGKGREGKSHCLMSHCRAGWFPSQYRRRAL